MKTKSKIIFSLFVICFVFLVFGRLLHDTYHKNIKSKKKMYCYELYSGVVHPALIVESNDHKDSLIQYYRKMEKGDLNPYFNFPPTPLPVDTCVYVIGYDSDSLIAEVVCYYDWGKQGDYIKGYVYRNTLHSNRPPTCLTKKNKMDRIKFLYDIALGIFIVISFFASIYYRIKTIRARFGLSEKKANRAMLLLTLIFWMIPLSKNKEGDAILHNKYVKASNSFLVVFIVLTIVLLFS